MRLEKQNRRSCLVLLLILGALAAVVLWMSLGGMPGETPADDPRGPVDAVPPPPGKAAPPNVDKPAPVPVG